MLKGPGFVPWGTMYKLETVGEGSRKLECVNCGFKMEWRIYLIAPEQFDARCSECKVLASHYWKDKPHRKVEDAQT
jgi:hypothetical protein